MATDSGYDEDAMFVTIMVFWMASVVLLIATLAFFMLNYCQKERRVNVVKYDASRDAQSKPQPFPYHTGNGTGPEMMESPDSLTPDYNFSFPGSDSGQADIPDVNENSHNAKATNF